MFAMIASSHARGHLPAAWGLTPSDLESEGAFSCHACPRVECVEGHQQPLLPLGNKESWTELDAKIKHQEINRLNDWIASCVSGSNDGE